jgi:hypothetical protein
MRYTDREIGELLIALSRFGFDASARLRWLDSFVERDLRRPEAAEQAAHEAILFALAERFSKPKDGVPTKMGGISDEVNDPKSIRDAASSVESAQEKIRAALKAFKSNGQCNLPFKVSGWERLSDGRVLPVVGGDWWSRVYAAVFGLMAELGPRFGICAHPKCCRLFLKSKRQAYHDKRCSQEERTRRWREKHPASVSDQRHKRYEKKQRARFGQNVKVARRAGRRIKIQAGGK